MKKEVTLFDYSKMCNKIKDCNNCPLSHLNNGTEKYCGKYVKEHTDEANKIILNWCEKNSIKTNKDKLKEVFPHIDFSKPNFCPKVFGSTIDCNEHTGCRTCMHEFWNNEYKEGERNE